MVRKNILFIYGIKKTFSINFIQNNFVISYTQQLHARYYLKNKSRQGKLQSIFNYIRVIKSLLVIQLKSIFSIKTTFLNARSFTFYVLLAVQ